MKKLLRYLPAIFIIGCSWYLSSQEHIEQMPMFWNADKLVHFICFGGLTFWVAFGINSNRRTLQIILPIIIVSVYGIIDETHQSFVPGRDVSFADWLADTIGAIFGSYCYVWVCKWIENYKNK